mgnify:CR=1 FL=1
MAVDAAGAITAATVLLALLSPRVGADKPASVAKLPAEVVHLRLPPAFSTAKRY